MTARVLPLALVIGLFGVSQADTASALGPAILLSITVSPAVTSISAGTTVQFTATGSYSNLTTKNLTDDVTWSSSASGTATVSNGSGSQGLATGVGTGVATISARDSSLALPGTAALTVTAAVPTDPTIPTIPDPTIPTVPVTLVAITVAPPVASIAQGSTQQFTATGTYSDLSTQDLTDSVTWSSSSSSTATISSTGLATASNVGAATITATDPSALVPGTAALTVIPLVTPPTLPASLVAITVSPPVADVEAGAGEQFTATGTYSDLSTATSPIR